MPDRDSTVSGGINNIASGAYAFVAGKNGRAIHTDSAVLAFDGGNLAGFPADGNGECVSQGDKTVTICASNGLYLNGFKLDGLTQEMMAYAIEASVALR